MAQSGPNCQRQIYLLENSETNFFVGRPVYKPWDYGDDHDTGCDDYGDDHDVGGADFQPWPDQSRILRLQLIGSDINIVYHCTSSSYLFTFGKGKQFLIAKTAFKNLILQKNPYFSGGLLC